jgi:hypothetical protein
MIVLQQQSCPADQHICCSSAPDIISRASRCHVCVVDDCLKAAGALTADHESDEDADERDTPGMQKKGKRSSETAGRSSGKGKSGLAKAALTAAKKPPVSKFAALRHSTYKALFGWLDPKFKRNGKKLLASNKVLWRFMVSCISCSHRSTVMLGWLRHQQL